MGSSIIKRSIVVAGHKTSVSLEDTFWNALKDLAGEQNMPVSALVNSIDKGRDTANLSSAVRQHLMRHYYDIASQKPAARDLAEARPVAPLHRAT